MGLFSRRPDVDTMRAQGDVAGLLKALGNSDAQVRRGAALALGGMERQEALSPLCNLLTRDPDGYVRSACARSLERLRNPLAVECLLWSLNHDEDFFVQKCAASALGVIGDPQAVEDLTKAMRTPKQARKTDEEAKDLDVRKPAAIALGRINSPQGNQALAHAQAGGVKYLSDAATEALLPKIVGESHYQAALANLAGRSPLQDAATRATAHLVPEPDNPYDQKAVAVRIQGQTVGYLQRADAGKYVKALGACDPPYSCAVEIRGGGGRDESGRDLQYGVFLVSPLEPDQPA